MICDLCTMFEKGTPLNWNDMKPDADMFQLNNHLTLCPECKSWLENILSIRSRYITMMKEIENY